MIPKPYVNYNDGSIRCYFESSKSPTCTLEDVINVLTEAKEARTTPVQYLMGFNEMYNNLPPEDLTPQKAAEYWRTFVQPAAVAVGLKLVSPTTKANEKGTVWFADFLKACWDTRNEALPCDIELIDKFAVHEYDCRESSWEELYRGGSSELISLLKSKLGDYGGKKSKQWERYLELRDLWVTETNCYWESIAPHPNSKEQCLRITGQMPGSHGMGSIAKMEAIDNIERYSWWTTWNAQIKPNYLTYKSGKLTPVAHGYLNPNNRSMDCNFPGDRMGAELAELGGQAEVIDCGLTGTEMIRSLGKGEGTASFTAMVPFAGNYAVNVGFLTAKERILSVSVNDDSPITTFSFVSSGEWCGNGGVSTVLPIEVESFVAGNNTITFGVQTAENEPLIEWISVAV